MNEINEFEYSWDFYAEQSIGNTGRTENHPVGRARLVGFSWQEDYSNPNIHPLQGEQKSNDQQTLRQTAGDPKVSGSLLYTINYYYKLENY